MDAPEERDIKLQRASDSLLAELKSRLPTFLGNKTTPPDGGKCQMVRRRAGRSDTDSLINLVRGESPDSYSVRFAETS